MTTETVLTDDEIHAMYSGTTGHRSIPPVVLKFARAIEQAVLQSPGVQAWKKDAERYRWLRDICGIVEYKQAFGSIGSGMIPSGKRLDVAIDAAMEKQP